MKRFLGWCRRIACAAGVLGASALACDQDPQSHVYEASLYEPTASCFDPSVSLGYIPTPSGDLDCAPTCLVLPSPAVGAEKIYVSTMCGPYPAGYDTSQTDMSCPAALAAWAAGGPDSCGSTVADAGPEAASVDDGGGDDGAATSDGSGPGADGGSDDGSAGDASDGGAPVDAPTG